MRRLGIAVLAVVAAFWWCGTDSFVGDAPGDSGATALLSAIVSGDFDRSHPLALVPADWASVMGFTPVVVAGPRGRSMLAKATGDCSSFTGRTKYDFTAVCMEHDLSYDVIRYAERIGAPLPAAARRSADDMFDRDLHARCDQLQVTGWDSLLCNTYATGFAEVVRVNSWRQGYRAPEPENALRWWAMALLALTLMALPFALSRLRHPRRRQDPFDLLRPGAGLPTHRRGPGQSSADSVSQVSHGTA